MSMDKDGFNNLDKEMQKDIAAARQKIEAKIKGQYMGKQYVGDRKMQNEAKAKDNAAMQAKINQELAATRQKIEGFHFGKDGRNTALEAMKKAEDNEKLQQKKNQLKQEFNRNNGRSK